MDRRQRRLYVTREGEKLALDLSRAQTRRFDRAMAELGADGRDEAVAFLLAMTDPGERDRVIELTGAKPPRIVAHQPRESR